MKKLMLFLSMVMMLSFVSCSSDSIEESAGTESQMKSEQGEMPTEEMVMESEEMTMETGDYATDSGETSLSEGNSNTSAGNINKIEEDERKIIYNAWVDVETESLTKASKELDTLLKEKNGYMASANTNAPSYEDAMPTGYYTCRVPQEQYEGFMEEIQEIGRIIREEESTEDITMDYIDVEARLKALETQEQSLISMLEQPGDLESLLLIQDRLMQVQYEIESYQAQKVRYDDMVSYCTVTVYITQVIEYTPQEESFGERIQKTFSSSWKDFGQGVQSLLLGIIYVLPGLIVIGFILVSIILVIRKVQQRKKTKKEENEE